MLRSSPQLVFVPKLNLKNNWIGNGFINHVQQSMDIDFATQRNLENLDFLYYFSREVDRFQAEFICPADTLNLTAKQLFLPVICKPVKGIFRYDPVNKGACGQSGKSHLMIRNEISLKSSIPL